MKMNKIYVYIGVAFIILGVLTFALWRFYGFSYDNGVRDTELRYQISTTNAVEHEKKKNAERMAKLLSRIDNLKKQEEKQDEKICAILNQPVPAECLLH